MKKRRDGDTARQSCGRLQVPSARGGNASLLLPPDEVGFSHLQTRVLTNSEGIWYLESDLCVGPDYTDHLLPDPGQVNLSGPQFTHL